MMKRMFMLMALALLLGAAVALSGVAQAKPTIGGSPGAQCTKLAINTLGKGFHPANYTFHSGTAGNDDFTGQATTGADVFCGFGGDDVIYTLDAGDIFLGGDGNDSVNYNVGTFYGGAGADSVGYVDNGNNNTGGTFYGGDGNDSVWVNYGTFNGDAGDDYAYYNDGGYGVGTFNGGAGADSVGNNISGGTFNGGADNDSVDYNYGTFNGDAGDDFVYLNYGTFNGDADNDYVVYPDASTGIFVQ